MKKTNRLRILATAMIATITGITASHGVVPFSDDFTISHDYATNGVTGTGWDGLRNQGNLTTGSASGGTLTWTTSGEWGGSAGNGNALGAFLYLNVSGDFSATVFADDNGGNFPLGGLMAVDPLSLPNNGDWVFLEAHHGNATVFLNTVDGLTLGDGNPARVPQESFLKLDRVGTTFFGYSRANESLPWSLVHSVDRPDIGNNIQLGLAVSSAGGGGSTFQDFAVVPEPASAMLVMAGAGMIAMRRRRN